MFSKNIQAQLPNWKEKNDWNQCFLKIFKRNSPTEEKSYQYQYLLKNIQRNSPTEEKNDQEIKILNNNK